MDDFAPYELSVKLKEKGFNEPCFGWYYPSAVCGFDYKTTIVFNNSAYRGSNYKDMLVSHKDEKYIDAPTISQVLKWLRKEKGLHIEIQHIFSEETLWDFEVAHIGSYERWWNNLALLDTYEQAVIAGIEYVLDNLI